MIKHTTYLLVVLCFLLSAGCKEAPHTYNPVGVGVDIDAVIASRGKILPQTCTLVPVDQIAKALEMATNEIVIKDSTPSGDDATHSSCFFKWTDHDLLNAGILLQVMKNPVGDEFPTYITTFIESKRTTGEHGVEGHPILFEKMEGLGDDGSYSTEAGKYYWRLGDKVICSIAFNTLHTPEQQYDIARQIGSLMTESYVKGSW